MEVELRAVHELRVASKPCSGGEDLCLSRRLGGSRDCYNSRARSCCVRCEHLLRCPDDDRHSQRSITNPFTSFTTAISTAVAGDTIYVRGGTYNLSSTISIGSSKNGTAANPYNLLAYPGESPILDFRGETYSATNSGQKGISLNGSYWRIKGLTVQYAADNGLPSPVRITSSSKSLPVKIRIPVS